MKNKYLVRNPQGFILVRCDSIPSAYKFIEQHIKNNKEHFRLLIGKVPAMSSYQITEIDKIPIYDKEC